MPPNQPPVAPDLLDAAYVNQVLSTAARTAFSVRIVAETGSTNDDLFAAATLPPGSVLAAERQTAGRGRRGRPWIAPPGTHLAFSLLWKFERDLAGLSGLSLAVGVAVLRAARVLGAAGIKLKWPNDLVALLPTGWAKIGGILIEARSGEAGSCHAVIGIGLNVSCSPAADLIGQRAASLADLGVPACRNDVLAAVLEALLPALNQFQSQGFRSFARDWNVHHAFSGETVKLQSEGVPVLEGIARDVDDDGALMIESESGMHHAVSGEVSLRAAVD